MTRADESISSSATAAQAKAASQSAATATSQPRTLAHVTAARRSAPQARPYLRLLWIIPSAATLAIGLWAYLGVEPGGTVSSIKIVTKPGPVGQASEALRLVTTSPDLYLKIKTADAELTTETYKDKAIGNGLAWPLPKPNSLGDVREVDVWDANTWPRSDKNIDHISMNGQWIAEGQTFRIELQGKANEPPKWALPTLSVGATLTALVILRFVWDQVV